MERSKDAAATSTTKAIAISVRKKLAIKPKRHADFWFLTRRA
jgi:hypothetical protein